MATNTSPIFITTSTLQSLLPHKTLIHHLRTSLPSATAITQSPIRHSHQTSPSSTLLLMPSWSLSYIGVKLVTTHPNNSTLNIPGVHASYVLFDSATGQTLASMDGTELTLRRTAAVSALASHYLSKRNAKRLLMIGAGSLAPHLIRSHLITRPSINHVQIWNRTTQKSKDLVEQFRKENLIRCDLTTQPSVDHSRTMQNSKDPVEQFRNESESLDPQLIRSHLTTQPSVEDVQTWNHTSQNSKDLVEEFGKESEIEGVRFEVCEDLETAVAMADIVSCATNSETPLVLGKWLKAGTHLDLVGSYKPSMKECDDDAVRKGRVFVDGAAAMVEAGELVAAFDGGVMKKDEVAGDLVELIKGEKSGRKGEEEITLFVSVGSAVVDLLSAQLVYETVKGIPN